MENDREEEVEEEEEPLLRRARSLSAITGSSRRSEPDRLSLGTTWWGWWMGTREPITINPLMLPPSTNPQLAGYSPSSSSEPPSFRSALNPENHPSFSHPDPSFSRSNHPSDHSFSQQSNPSDPIQEIEMNTIPVQEGDQSIANASQHGPHPQHSKPTPVQEIEINSTPVQEGDQSTRSLTITNASQHGPDPPGGSQTQTRNPQPRLSLSRMKSLDGKLEILGSLNHQFTAIVILGFALAWSTASLLDDDDPCKVGKGTMRKVTDLEVAAFVSFLVSAFLIYACRTTLKDWIAVVEEDIESGTINNSNEIGPSVLVCFNIFIGISLLMSVVGTCCFIGYMIYLYEVRLGRIDEECSERSVILVMYVVGATLISLAVYCIALVNSIRKYRLMR